MSAVYIADSPPMMVWAYVFIKSRQPKRLLPRVRSISGVVHADALFGSPDIIAIVAGDNIKVMDEVIDQIAELSDVVATDTKVARWLDGIGPPNSAYACGLSLVRADPPAGGFLQLASRAAIPLAK